MHWKWRKRAMIKRDRRLSAKRVGGQRIVGGRAGMPERRGSRATLPCMRRCTAGGAPAGVAGMCGRGAWLIRIGAAVMIGGMRRGVAMARWAPTARGAGSSIVPSIRDAPITLHSRVANVEG